MAEKPDTLPCACGGVSTSLIAECEFILKDSPFAMKPDQFDLPIGWEKGNVDPDKQEARYGRMIDADRKRSRAYDKKAIKNGIRKIASVPRELYRLRQRKFGKDYWQDDTKNKLKRDGLLHVD